MRILCLAVLIALFAFGAMAQSPIVETAFQYQLLRVNSSQSFPSFTANGGTGSVQVNVFNQVAGVLEVGAEYNGNIKGVPVSNTWMSYLVGPRISLVKRSKKIIPALECLVGGTTLFAVLANQTVNTTGFAMALGGTIDIRVSRHMDLRPVQLDYMLTRVNNTYNQNNLRYGAGVVFTFGKQL
jgi:hypothetical protein